MKDKGNVRRTYQGTYFASEETGYGKQVSINVEMKEQIMKYIDEFLKME